MKAIRILPHDGVQAAMDLGEVIGFVRQTDRTRDVTLVENGFGLLLEYGNRVKYNPRQ